ncbi:MAG: D-alanine--D-alanine ligase family protein [Devosia sp.]
MRIAILTPPPATGARADLHDTFVQADEIAAVLDNLGHESFPAIFGSDRPRTTASLRRLAPDLVFNLVEDVVEGPDQVHVATALLDSLGLRHTGASTAALEALGDKRVMKASLRDAGLPVAPAPGDDDGLTRYIVKSAIEHSSVGISEANVVAGRIAAEALIAGRRDEFGGDWFAEAYVEGRELNISMLEAGDGPITLPVAEILFTNHPENRPRVVGYAEKWATGTAAYDATPQVFPSREEALFTELNHLSLAAWRLFALTGYARVDFRVDAAGQPIILEVNANPCLAADAGFCAAAAAAGMSQADVIDHIIKAAR